MSTPDNKHFQKRLSFRMVRKKFMLDEAMLCKMQKG